MNQGLGKVLTRHTFKPFILCVVLWCLNLDVTAVHGKSLMEVLNYCEFRNTWGTYVLVNLVGSADLPIQIMKCQRIYWGVKPKEFLGLLFSSFFSVQLLSVLRGHSFFHPRHNSQWTSDFYPLHLFSYLNSWERASIFPFECSVLNKGTTGTVFITSLVWCGPWLGIERGTSRTRSQHYTTRLSRRRYSATE